VCSIVGDLGYGPSPSSSLSSSWSSNFGGRGTRGGSSSGGEGGVGGGNAGEEGEAVLSPMRCSLCGRLMLEPVVAADGFSYER